jgi:hypothetical protein
MLRSSLRLADKAVNLAQFAACPNGIIAVATMRLSQGGDKP